MKILFFLTLYLTIIHGGKESIESSLETVTTKCLRTESDNCMSDEVTVRQRRIIRTTTNKPVVLPRGPLFDFIVNICLTLKRHYRGNKISSYFKMLARSLKNVGPRGVFKHLLNKLSKKLTKLSFKNGRVLHRPIKAFLEIIKSGKNTTNEFFYTINKIYSYNDDRKLDDYIYLMRKYGEGDTKHIGERTRDVFELLVMYRLRKQKEDVMMDLEKKLLTAYIELYSDKKNGTE